MECRKLKFNVLTVTYSVEWILHPSVKGNIQIWVINIAVNPSRNDTYCWGQFMVYLVVTESTVRRRVNEKSSPSLRFWIEVTTLYVAFIKWMRMHLRLLEALFCAHHCSFFSCISSSCIRCSCLTTSSFFWHEPS